MCGVLLLFEASWRWRYQTVQASGLTYYIFALVLSRSLHLLITNLLYFLEIFQPSSCLCPQIAVFSQKCGVPQLYSFSPPLINCLPPLLLTQQFFSQHNFPFKSTRTGAIAIINHPARKKQLLLLPQFLCDG